MHIKLQNIREKFRFTNESVYVYIYLSLKN